MSSSPARFFPGAFARGNGNGANGKVSAHSCEKPISAGENAGAGEAEVRDEALMLRLQEKDISALELLYRRYARLVYSLSSRIIRDQAEAEDLVHEVFLSLYRRCGSFDPAKGTARSWLVQLTYHKCFDWRDYLKARHGMHQGNGNGTMSSPLAEPVEERDPVEPIRIDLMTGMLGKLTREQQEAFKLRAAGHTFPEIAEKLRCTEGNAKNHLYRGIRHLREMAFDGDRREPAPIAHQDIKFHVKSAGQ